MESNKMMSLYDYLGRAAGSNLGNRVYKQAKEQGVSVQTRLISTKNYKGQVLLYPKEFLERYFS
jgi:hypothetical protein